MTSELASRCRELAVELGLGAAEDVTRVEPLTGGVASDIAMVEVGGRRLCMKFALPKLKVQEDWRAPVHRNRAEYEWLSVAARIAPESAVRLHGRSEDRHGFAMEFLEGGDVRLWKADLLEGRRDAGRPARVADLLGRVHAASAAEGFDDAPFRNRDDFRALRIEPYLTFTAGRRPEVSAELTALADMLYEADATLIHGDVSPKNILFRESGPVILDAECATMGDPCFDLAFCLNHLVLKALHVPALRRSLAEDVASFRDAYAPHASWEAPEAVERRTCRLLPALMLGRIDGKSPVEYLDEAERDAVRRLALPLIEAPSETLSALIGRLDLNGKEAGA